MRIAVWGHLSLDVNKEGEPKNIIDRCKCFGIDIYLAHVYPGKTLPVQQDSILMILI